jgi:spore germination protein KA
MFRFIQNKYRNCRLRAQQRGPLPQREPVRENPVRGLSDRLKENLDAVKDRLGDSGDVKTHEFFFGKNCEFCGALIFVDGLVNELLITESILKPLLLNREIDALCGGDAKKTLEAIKSTLLCAGDITRETTLEGLIKGCLGGDVVFLCDGCPESLVISAKGWEKRSVTEPQTESVVRGPREGFTENFRTNTALLRRRIKSPDLRIEQMVIGQRTRTNVCIAYIEGVANPKTVELARYRLGRIDVDSILDTGNLEAYIEDAPFSVFSTVGYSEKPDVAAAKILEGRVAIVADGSPFVLTVPMLFIEAFQSAEDYYTRTYYASTTRILRFLAYFISVFAPAIYIALTTFHQELLPTTLLFTVAGAREGTPFPGFIEAFIMILSFEILKEAGLRLPRPVGQAVSIVGALIMGESAVSAGLVGAPMVITVAITAVAGFVVPEQLESASILRLTMMVLAATLGGFGIAMGFLGMLVHLAALKSFGVAYFGGIIPLQDMQDVFVRMPLWSMVRRPQSIAGKDDVRRKFFIPPGDPPNSGGQKTEKGEGGE